MDKGSEPPSTYLLPGFIDAHVHVESSMLVPSEFARAAVVHGTVATVSDPHEIGNVLGVAGVQYMLDNAAQSPFKFYFGAPVVRAGDDVRNGRGGDLGGRSRGAARRSDASAISAR